MPRNGSGTYTLPTGNPVSPGTTIESAWANTTLSDIGTELTNSLSRTGAGGMLAAFRLADGTLAAPGVAFLNETGTGFYRAGSGEMWAAVQGIQIQQYTTGGVLIPTGKTFTAQGASTFSGALSYTSTLTGGTGIVNLGSGQFYKSATGDVGIGTISPSVKLDVNGSVSIALGSNLTWGGAYGVGTPTIAGSTAGGGALAFYPAGSTSGESMRLDAAGSLGVGTAAPTFGSGSGVEIQRAGIATLRLENSTASNSFELYADTAANGINLRGRDSSPLVLWTANTEKMRLDASGNIGLGVVPSAWSAGKAFQIGARASLFAFSDDVNTGLNTYYDGTNFRYIQTGFASLAVQTAGQHRWFTAPSGTAGNAISFTQAMTLDASGNLGVGTATPNAKLNVVSTAQSVVRVKGGASAGQSAAFYVERAGSTTTLGAFGDSAAILGGTVDQAVAIYADSSIPITFNQSSTERARIDSSGNLLVGTTSSSSSRFVASADLNNQVAYVVNTNTTVTGAVGGIYVNYTAASPNNTVFEFLRCTDSTTTRAKILSNGNLQNINNSYGAISDLKLKENISDATPKLDKLLQVRVVNYNLKTQPDQKHIGVIAQELEQVFPGMVEESPDRDAEGNDLGTTTKGVKYSVFVPMLIKALQEQQSIIASLTARVAALEA